MTENVRIDQSAATKNWTPYQKIKEASATTGLSQFFLRNGCKSGFVPCLRSGSTYYVNIPALLKKLDSQSERSEAG